MAPRRRWKAAVLAVLTGGVLAFSAAPAAAVGTHMYDNFTRCPTTSPEMNDPTTQGVVCISTLVQGGLIRVGNFQASITPPLHVQFAGLEREEKLVIIPGTTTLEANPILVPNPLAALSGSSVKVGSAHPANPAMLALTRAIKARTDKQAKKHHKPKKHHKKKHKKKKKKKPAAPVVIVTPGPSTPAPAPSPAPAPPAETDPNIHIAVETVGDLEDLELAGILGGEVPLFKMGLRLHLTGVGLGSNCYIGSAAEPISIQPSITFPPSSFNLGKDPNGFTVEILSLGGFSMADEEFTVPGATGCGTPNGSASGGSLDQTIDGAIGLPAISGGSKVLFANDQLDMVGAIFDGTPPEGGEAMHDAFEAAKE